MLNASIEVIRYFRFDAKTGIKAVYQVMDMNRFYSPYRTKNGKPRKSIVVKGKTYYKE